MNVVDLKKPRKAYSKPRPEDRAEAVERFRSNFAEQMKKTSRGGRPSAYLPEFCDMLVAFGLTGRSMTAFAGELMVCKETLYTWIGCHPEFAQAARIFRAVRTNTLEREILDTSVASKVQARLSVLKNLNPDDWRDRKEYAIGGNDDLPAIKSESTLTPAQAYMRAIGQP